MAGKKSRRWLVGFVGVAALATLSVLALVAFARPATTVDSSRVATIERGDLARSVVATGRIEPITKVEIKSKANGIIKELKVQVGDRVVSGQVLAELDRDNLAARLRESKAALAGADANLKAAVAELAKNTVEAQGPEVAFARRNVERAEQLLADKLISAQSMDDARSALDQAVNRQAVARSQLGVTEARVAQARASVAQAQAAVDRSEEELTNATIRSPINGVVLSRDVEVGSPVSSILNLGSSATLVMVLGDISQVYVKGKVDEADIGLVRMAQPARIKVETFKDRSVRRARDADRADGRRARQRRQLRSARVDRQLVGRTAGEHDLERRDRPRGAQGHARHPRARGHLRRLATDLRRAHPAGEQDRERARADHRRHQQRHAHRGRKGLAAGDRVVLQ